MDFRVTEKRESNLFWLAGLGLVVSFYLGLQNSVLFYESLPHTIPEDGIVVFYQPACPHCVAEIPVIRKLVENGYTVHAINVLERPELVEKYGIQATPTVMIMPSGVKLVGEKTYDEIIRALHGEDIEDGEYCSLEVNACSPTSQGFWQG